MKRALILCAAALLVLGCEQKTEAPAGAGSAKPMTTSAAGTTAPAGAGATVAVADDVPSESDFEEEAAKEITADNLDAELDKIDKEIGQ